jgi:hypothetical protein
VDKPCLSWTEAVKNPYSEEIRSFLKQWILSKTKR